jgi:hypothetical protein
MKKPHYDGMQRVARHVGIALGEPVGNPYLFIRQLSIGILFGTSVNE